MMYVQLFSKFVLFRSTTLAGVIISMPCVSLLLSPVRAIIGRITAAPIEVICPAINLAFRLPFSKALFRTKSPSIRRGLFDVENLVALRAYLFNALISFGMRPGYFWSRFTFQGCTQMLTKTFSGAKSNPDPLFTFGYLFVALFAKLRADMYDAKISLHTDSRCSASNRAISCASAFSAREFLTTLRTNFGYPAKTIRTFLRTAFAILIRWINLEGLITNNTISHLSHSI